MTNEIPVLAEELEKLATRIMEELQSFLVELSGSLKVIDSGTLIKIPTAAGYVNFFKSQEMYSIKCWMNEEMTTEKMFDQTHILTVNDE